TYCTYTRQYDRPYSAVVVTTCQRTIDAAVESMKSGATDFSEKPHEVDTLRRTLRTVQEERRARTLLGGTAGQDAIAGVLSDAATPGVLLAVVGPRAPSRSRATCVVR